MKRFTPILALAVLLVAASFAQASGPFPVLRAVAAFRAARAQTFLALTAPPVRVQKVFVQQVQPAYVQQQQAFVKSYYAAAVVQPAVSYVQPAVSYQQVYVPPQPVYAAPAVSYFTAPVTTYAPVTTTYVQPAAIKVQSVQVQAVGCAAFFSGY